MRPWAKETLSKTWSLAFWKSLGGSYLIIGSSFAVRCDWQEPAKYYQWYRWKYFIFVTFPYSLWDHNIWELLLCAKELYRTICLSIEAFFSKSSKSYSKAIFLKLYYNPLRYRSVTRKVLLMFTSLIILRKSCNKGIKITITQFESTLLTQ